MKKILIVSLFICASSVFYKSCVSHKLDEKKIFKKNGIELKVSTYFENLPFHFNGNIYRIECKSRHTKYKSIPTHSGFLKLGYTSDSDFDIDVLAKVAREGYHVTDQEVMIVSSDKSIFITWNGCLSFSTWSLENIVSEDLVESTPQYKECLLQTKKNMNWPHIRSRVNKLGSIEKSCQSQKFSGNNLPVFSNFQAASNGTASVLIQSGAFKNSRSIIVKIRDFGKNWTIKNYSK